MSHFISQFIANGYGPSILHVLDYHYSPTTTYQTYHRKAKQSSIISNKYRQQSKCIFYQSLPECSFHFLPCKAKSILLRSCVVAHSFSSFTVQSIIHLAFPRSLRPLIQGPMQFIIHVVKILKLQILTFGINESLLSLSVHHNMIIWPLCTIYCIQLWCWLTICNSNQNDHSMLLYDCPSINVIQVLQFSFKL